MILSNNLNNLAHCKVDSRGAVICMPIDFSINRASNKSPRSRICLIRVNFTRHGQYGDVLLGVPRDFLHCRISAHVRRDVAITTCVKQANKLI